MFYRVLSIFAGHHGHPTSVTADLESIRALFNEKENALVQMSDSTQAQLGNHLHSPALTCTHPVSASIIHLPLSFDAH